MIDPPEDTYRQQIVYGRGMLWAPWYAVGIAARIGGRVPADLLRGVLPGLGILHPPLASRVSLDDDGAAWLTTAGVGDFALEIRPKTSEKAWAEVFQEQERIPFPFGRGPLARFVLLCGERSSDLVLVAPHVVCDGHSLAHVMLDLASLLNDPSQPVAPPSPPPAATVENVARAGKPSPLLAAGVKVLNARWPAGRKALCEEDYLELHRRYWMRNHPSSLVLELAPPELSDLLARCRHHHVSLTGAFVAAFLLALSDSDSAAAPRDCLVGVAVNIRDRLSRPPGVTTGMYASAIDIKVRVGPGSTMWDLARVCHSRIHAALADTRRLLRPLVLNEMKPAIIDAFCAALCTGEWSRQLDLLSRFIPLKGRKHDLRVSNSGRFEGNTGSACPLDALFIWPPLIPGAGFGVCTVTYGGRLSLVVRFREDELQRAEVARIRACALEHLLGAQ